MIAMRSRLLLPLLLALAAFAQEAPRIPKSFRIKKDPETPMRGYVLQWDQEGFLFQYFGDDAQKARLFWIDLVEEDAKKMRIEFKLDQTEEEKAGLIDGHRIWFRGGGTEEGLLLGRTEDGDYKIKVRGFVLHYPGDRVDRIEELKIKESMAYDEEEIYARQLERTPPQTAPQHKALADRMFDVGNLVAAREHYRKALELDASFGKELSVRLSELEDYLADDQARAVIMKAKSRAVLDGEYEESIALLEQFSKEHPDRARAAGRVLEEIREYQQRKLSIRFSQVKHEELDRAIENYLTRKAPASIQTAMSWVSGELPGELQRRVRNRMNFDGAQFEAFLGLRTHSAPHWASYWSGSFVLSGRTKKSAPKGGPKADPDLWWNTYTDTQTRSSWLKAFAAERLPELFEVVMVNNRDCERCGGVGQVKKMSFQGVEGVGHEWMEVCPRCFGACQDRGIGYR